MAIKHYVKKADHKCAFRHITDMPRRVYNKAYYRRANIVYVIRKYYRRALPTRDYDKTNTCL